MPATFPQIWTNALRGEAWADLIASIRQEAINDYLRKHRDWDSSRYTQEVSFPIDPKDPKKKFVAKIVVGDEQHPLQVAFPPFGENIDDVGYYFDDSLGRTDLELENGLGKGEPNIRVVARKVRLHLKWPKRQGAGEWEWKPPALKMTAAARVSLTEQDNRFSISLHLKELGITEDTGKKLGSLSAYIRDSAPKDLAREVENCEQKFNDLLVSVLNYLAGTLAPDLVHNIEVPVIEIKDLELRPSLLRIADNALTVGAGVDIPAMRQQGQERADYWLSRLERALEEDIDDAGGLEAILVGERKATMIASAADAAAASQLLLRAKPQSDAAIERAFTRANLVLDELRAVAEEKVGGSVVARKAAARRGDDGMAVGFNEYLVDRLLSSALPAPKSDCTNEKNLRLIKGKICHWSRINDPEVKINRNGSLTGSANLDVGAALHYRLKRFLDCSWRWGSWHRIELGLVGRPKLNIRVLERRGGLSVLAKADLDGLRIQTNLGKWIDKLLNVVGKLFIKAIEALLNLVGAFMSFKVIPVEIQIPTQKTGLKLSKFKAFYFERTGGSTLPADRRTYLGHSVRVVPKKF